MTQAATFATLKPHVIVGLGAAATLLAFTSTAQSAAELGYHGEAVPWLGLFKARLVGWYICALFVPFLSWLALVRPIGAVTWKKAIPLHLAAGLACALAKESLFVTVGNWFRPGVFHLPEILAGDYFDEVLLFWAMIGVIHAYIGHREASGAPPTPRRGDAGCEAFVVRAVAGYRMVHPEEVGWIDAQGNYARLHTATGSHLVRGTMAELEHRLAGPFVRVHRGAIVNRRHIVRVEARSHGAYRIMLSSGEAVATGRTYVRAVRRLLTEGRSSP